MTKIDFYITDISDHQELLGFACRLTEKAVLKNHQVYIHCDSEATMMSMDQLLWSFRPNSFLPHTMETAAAAHTPDAQTQDSETDLEANIEANIESINETINETSENKSAPILIGCSGDTGEHHDVLVNLTAETPRFFSRFLRLAEVVQSDPIAKEKSRERFRFYRDRGYPLKVHNL